MAESDRYLAPGHSLDELKAADGQTGYADILKHGVTGQGLNDYAAIFR
ncbi:MAG: sugar phosphate isomerase/epimerase, partial [Planctomycetes bacterium]|nr:sugar phosphate isomerase/epimerase [Planctomycetota bacterium]